MDRDSVALEISSDEDVGDDRDWLSKLLDDLDESDEVTVIGEVKPRQRTTKCDLDDDDCVVLDADPDSLVQDVNDSVSGTDDLLIVGEKGQIACRDYPHSRSFCAKFPFNSTPHKEHCDMCHCYVCDSPAPCAHWDSGIPILDHCHATDKEEVWRLLRRDLKEEKKKIQNSVPSVSPQSNITPQGQIPRQAVIGSCFATIPQSNTMLQGQIPRQPVIRACSATIPQHNTIPQGQIPRQSMFRACSTTTNSTSPTIIIQDGTAVAENHLVKNRYQASLISQQLLNVGNNDIRRSRVHCSGNLGSRSIYHHPEFKKARPGPTNNLHPSASDYCQRHETVSALSSRDPPNRQVLVQPLNLESFTCQNLPQPIIGNYFGHGGRHQLQTDGQVFWQEHSSETQPLVSSSFVDFSSSGQNDTANLGSKNFSNDPQFPKPSDCSSSMNYCPGFLPVFKPSSPSIVTESDCQFPPFLRPPEPSTIFPPPLSPISSALKEFEDWLMENQPVSGDFEGTMPLELT